MTKPKFVSICFEPTGTLTALDADGQIWWLSLVKDKEPYSYKKYGVNIQSMDLSQV